MARQKESNFSDRVASALDKLPYTWHLRLPAVLAGLPDRIACINGQFVALELKKDKASKASKLQRYVLEQLSNAGAYAVVVNPENWDEIHSHLEGFVWRQK